MAADVCQRLMMRKVIGMTFSYSADFLAFFLAVKMNLSRANKAGFSTF